jgi:hypothetical protein
MRAHEPSLPQETLVAIRHDVVEQQLDNINVLAEALATAIRDGDSENEAKLRVSLGRSVVAFRWGADPRLLATLSYANARDDSDDDLFAPAFILTSTAPDRSETRQILARLTEDAHALLARVTSV